MEIWKKIDGFENYEVSNYGNVRSLNYNNQNIIKILKPVICSNGYYGVGLSLNGKSKTFSIHRLVAIRFINNYDNKKEVNHINGIKTDNRVENLEWCTRLENAKHAKKNNLLKSGKNHYLYGKYNEKHHLSKKIINIKTNEVYDCVNVLSKILKIKPNTLASKLNGKNKNTTDFIYLKKTT